MGQACRQPQVSPGLVPPAIRPQYSRVAVPWRLRCGIRRAGTRSTSIYQSIVHITTSCGDCMSTITPRRLINTVTRSVAARMSKSFSYASVHITVHHKNRCPGHVCIRSRSLGAVARDSYFVTDFGLRCRLQGLGKMVVDLRSRLGPRFIWSHF